MTTLPLRLLTVLFLLTACRVSAEELTHLWTSSAAPVVPLTVAFHEDLVIRLDDRLEKLEAVSVADGSLRWEHSLGSAQNPVSVIARRGQPPIQAAKVDSHKRRPLSRSMTSKRPPCNTESVFP